MKRIILGLRLLVNLTLAAMFFLFASVQFNDPDPLIWVLAYSLTAVLSLLFLWRLIAEKLKWVYLGIALVMFIGSFLQFPPTWEGFGAEMKTENNELARESIGLLLCGLVLLIQFATIKPYDSGSASNTN